MKRILISVIGLLLCSTVAFASDLKRSFEIGGLTRTYFLHVPKNLPANAPLVFVLHGHGGSAEGMIGFSQMNPVADKNGFAVCYPQGTEYEKDKHFWKAGYASHKDLDVDDVEFLATLAKHLQEEFNLSRQNTFCTGMSNGGDMCYLLACQKPDVFAAVAPVAGCMIKWIRDACDSADPIPVFEIHGTKDPITLWDGDMDDNQGYGGYLDVPAAFEFWSKKNKCTKTVIDTLPNTDTEDGSSVVSEKRTGGTGNHEVWLYTLVDGKHDWPGTWGNKDINASEEIWKFFSVFVKDTPEKPSIAHDTRR